MYILLIGIHTIFIICSHLLGLYVLEGIFIILFLYFLLYFSPFFFQRNQTKASALSLFSSISFSPKNSLFLPLSLFSFALFFFLYGISNSLVQTVEYSVYFLIGLSIIIFSYMLVFDWRVDIFFDITRFHAVLSSGFVIILGVLSLLGVWSGSWYWIFLGILLSIYFFLLFSSEIHENPLLFQGAITVLFFTLYSAVVSVFPVFNTLPLFFLFLVVFAISCFEGILFLPRFASYVASARVYLLLLTLFASSIVVFYSLSHFYMIFFSILSILFLLSVHIRYCNYITFGFSILGIYFLYASLFSSLILSGSFFSTILFAFFLPLCIIGNTYFWEEHFPYDFSMLHFSSILFSSIASLYIVFFLPWGLSLFFVISGCVFALGVLLFLSFFRYRYR